MRSLILFLVFLAGCTPPRYWNPEEPEVKSIPVSGSKNFVAWKCVETQINDKLIWVECEFKNQSTIRTTDSVCLEISYHNEQLKSSEVTHSRKVCSGALAPFTSAMNYAAFIKTQRQLLTQYCGLDNKGCLIRVKEVTHE